MKIVLDRGIRSGRTTADQWQSVADALARDGQALGFPRRSGSSCRQRAVVLGVYRQSREPAASAIAAAASVSAQASFAPREVRLEIAAILERLAKELRGA